MYMTKKVVSCFVLCVLIFSLCACGKESKDNADIYGVTIGGLEDNAALDCDVYYLVDKEIKNIGSIESMGTAYPISYDETGIYTASGHAMQRFEVEKSGTLKLAEVINEQFDENGNAAYTMTKENETKTISEEDYYAAFEKYSNATIVSFAYGASDAAR